MYIKSEHATQRSDEGPHARPKGKPHLHVVREEDVGTLDVPVHYLVLVQAGDSLRKKHISKQTE
jgi:hypothetical protein